MELEKEIEELRVRVGVLEKLLDRVSGDASEALIEVKALKASTHKIEYINPFSEETLGDTPKEVSEVEREKPQKISPFTAFSSFKSSSSIVPEDDIVREDPSEIFEEL